MKLPGIDNWQLKLLALALAIVIYHALKTETASEHNSNHDRSFFRN